MATYAEDVARSALAAVGSNAGTLQAVRWTSERYRQLANKGKLRALRKVESLVIPAAITDGTVTVTTGSRLVTPDATALAAWNLATSTVNADTQAGLGDDVLGTSTSLVGRYFRVARVWYKIAAFTNGVIQLKEPFSESPTGGVSSIQYKLVQRHTRMPKDFRFIGQFLQERLWRPITQVSLKELDYMQPERLFVAGTGPEMVCEVGDDEDGVRLFEFYPYTLRAEKIMFTYFAKSPDLQPDSKLPDDLDVEALRMGVLLDVYRFEMAQALRANQVEVAAVWRNELRAQEKTWEDRMNEMYRTDRASDDIAVILHTQGPPVFGDFTFIRTARQDAISRLGNFP